MIESRFPPTPLSRRKEKRHFDTAQQMGNDNDAFKREFENKTISRWKPV
jgi:hypothetical protein